MILILGCVLSTSNNAHQKKNTTFLICTSTISSLTTLKMWYDADMTSYLAISLNGKLIYAAFYDHDMFGGIKFESELTIDPFNADNICK